MAPSAGTLRVGRYFAVLLGLFVVLYGVAFWPGQRHTPKLGLDLEGGAQVTLKAQTVDGKNPSKSSLDQAREIITNRVNGLGVAAAEVVTQGGNRIVVSVPGAGANDVAGLATTAQLAFRPLLVAATDATDTTTTAPSATASATGSATGSATATPTVSSSAKASAKASGTPTSSASPRGRVVPHLATTTAPAKSTAAKTTAKASATPIATPSTSSTAVQNPFLTQKTEPIDQWKLVGFTPPTTPAAVAALQTTNPTQYSTLNSAIAAWPCDNTHTGLDVATKPLITCSEDNTTKYLLGPVIVAGTQVKDATAFAPGTQQGVLDWTVSLDLKPTGQKAWADYTAKHNVTVDSTDIGNTVADTLDGKVIVASVIQQTITGTTQISGTGIDGTTAPNLANSLKYGALPLKFTQEAAQTVSATLGTSQLKAGLLAGGIGLALVVVYSLFYYRALGLVTIASLAVSGGLTYAMLIILGKQIGFTLTLAGIAGFIVAVGITADSFVVFFERIKDEVHEGRSARTAIPRAWTRSKRTILSADTVSFLAAATLYYFAAGDVKGFAFTLGLSTIIDLIVVFFFTHPLVSLFSRSAAFGSARFTGLDHVRSGGVVPSGPIAAESPISTEVATDAGTSAGRATIVIPRLPETASGAAGSEDATEVDDEPVTPTAKRKKAPTRAPSSAAGGSAAERAAARRGLTRETDTTDSSASTSAEDDPS